MSLSTDDLSQIRTINREENAPLDGKVTALQNDVKEIYYMLAKMQNAPAQDKQFHKLPLKQKILSVHQNLMATAQEAGVTLPQN